MQGALEKVLGIASAHYHEDWNCFKLSGSLSIARPPMLWDGQALCKRFKTSKCTEELNVMTLQQISTTNPTAEGGRHGVLPGRIRGILHHWTNPCHRWGQEHYVSSLEIGGRTLLDVFLWKTKKTNQQNEFFSHCREIEVIEQCDSFQQEVVRVRLNFTFSSEMGRWEWNRLGLASPWPLRGCYILKIVASSWILS